MTPRRFHRRRVLSHVDFMRHGGLEPVRDPRQRVRRRPLDTAAPEPLKITFRSLDTPGGPWKLRGAGDDPPRRWLCPEAEAGFPSHADALAHVVAHHAGETVSIEGPPIN